MTLKTPGIFTADNTLDELISLPAFFSGCNLHLQIFLGKLKTTKELLLKSLGTFFGPKLTQPPCKSVVYEASYLIDYKVLFSFPGGDIALPLGVVHAWVSRMAQPEGGSYICPASAPPVTACSGITNQAN